jgi:DNA-binding transcriptional MerR regulator
MVPQQKTSPRRVSVALRRAEALKLRSTGMHLEDIAEALSYSSISACGLDIQRALAATVREPAEEVRQIELRRLDAILVDLNAAYRKAEEVSLRNHVAISQGRVVYDDTGAPVIDDAPVISALAQMSGIQDRRLKVQDRRAKYLGLDAPTKLEVVTVDVVDAEIRRLTDEIARASNFERAETLQATGAQETPE